MDLLDLIQNSNFSRNLNSGLDALIEGGLSEGLGNLNANVARHGGGGMGFLNAVGDAFGPADDSVERAITALIGGRRALKARDPMPAATVPEPEYQVPSEPAQAAEPTAQDLERIIASMNKGDVPMFSFTGNRPTKSSASKPGFSRTNKPMHEYIGKDQRELNKRRAMKQMDAEETFNLSTQMAPYSLAEAIAKAGQDPSGLTLLMNALLSGSANNWQLPEKAKK